MKRTVAATLLVAATTVHAEVTVEFKGSPDAYKDIGLRQLDREGNLEAIRKIFVEAGAQYAPNLGIKVEILDVDLAGREVPSRNGGTARMMSEKADYPTIVFTYSVNGTAPQRKKLSDPNYLDQSLRATGSFPYERRMVERWFHERFGKPAKGSSK